MINSMLDSWLMLSKHFYYGWVIAIVGACIQLVYALGVYSFGVFLRPITLEFGGERGASNEETNKVSTIRTSNGEGYEVCKESP